jgi:hypothetical protein
MVHSQRLKAFCISLFILESIIIILYGIFVRFEPHQDSSQVLHYVFFQNINVMMLIGFGFLMTFIKGHSWSALSYTFLINALILQLYLLLQPFWQRVFFEGFSHRFIEIK